MESRVIWCLDRTRISPVSTCDLTIQTWWWIKPRCVATRFNSSMIYWWLGLHCQLRYDDNGWHTDVQWVSLCWRHCWISWAIILLVIFTWTGWPFEDQQVQEDVFERVHTSVLSKNQHFDCHGSGLCCHGSFQGLTWLHIKPLPVWTLRWLWRCMVLQS